MGDAGLLSGVPQASHPRVYDRIGLGYTDQRVPDPRIAARIRAALGDAQTVCNVGAGAGSYEPEDRRVTAVEPSPAMIAQRRGSNVVRAVAEKLPFADAAFDAAMATLTIHHWLDIEAGLREMRRIAPRCVLFTFDPALQESLWLIRDYFPSVIEFENSRHPPIDRVAEWIGADRVEPVAIPWDCTDGFQAANWRRPERYLDATVRASISTFAQRSEDELIPGLRALAADLESGAWHDRYADLLKCDEMDFGYRLVIRTGTLDSG
jgi:SAM-dependent methyltransferase